MCRLHSAVEGPKWAENGPRAPSIVPDLYEVDIHLYMGGT